MANQRSSKGQSWKWLPRSCCSWRWKHQGVFCTLEVQCLLGCSHNSRLASMFHGMSRTTSILKKNRIIYINEILMTWLMFVTCAYSHGRESFGIPFSHSPTPDIPCRSWHNGSLTKQAISVPGAHNLLGHSPDLTSFLSTSSNRPSFLGSYLGGKQRCAAFSYLSLE